MIPVGETANLDVSGTTAGMIEIGGPARGKGDLYKAQTVRVEDGAELHADSTDQGAVGGHIVLWSEQNSKVSGNFSANSQNGKGGFVETSSAQDLNFGHLTIKTKGALGAGMWLLDPSDITIDSTLAQMLENNLANTNVKLSTSSSGGDHGDITVGSNIINNTDNNLYLEADRNINVKAQISGNGTGTLTLRADRTGSGTGTVSFNGGSIVQNNGTVEIYYNPTGTGSAKYSGSNKSIVGTDQYASHFSGTGTLNSYMLVNNSTDLGCVSSLVNAGTVTQGKFAIGKAFSLSGVTYTPIGTSTNPFDGYFNGQNYVISDLSISGALADAGFFGYIGNASSAANATISNMALSNVNVSSSLDSANVGGLVGDSEGGIIKNSYTTGAVSSTGVGVNIGGLAGYQNTPISTTATVSNSYSSVTITYATNTDGYTSYIGGLIGKNYKADVNNSYATGDVNANANSVTVGGLIGYIYEGSSSSSYASGNISATGYQSIAGGYAGAILDHNVNNAYATGSVEGGYGTTAGSPSLNSYVGGFAGVLGIVGDSGATNNAYSTGAVTQVSPPSGGYRASVMGGFTGRNYGAITNGIWDTTSNNTAANPSVGVGASTTTGVTGYTDAEMRTPSTFTGLSWSTSIWNFESNSLPTLVNVGLSTPASYKTIYIGQTPAYITAAGNINNTTQSSLQQAMETFNGSPSNSGNSIIQKWMNALASSSSNSGSSAFQKMISYVDASYENCPNFISPLSNCKTS